MDNKYISNTTEASTEGILNNCTEPNVSRATYNLSKRVKPFDDVVNNIKAENDSLFHNESSDSEDSASITSIDNKNEKQQDQMCELASTSYEKDVNVSESYSQELTDKKLVDSKIVRMHTSSLATVLSIINILSPKLGSHICLEYCFKCRMVFRVLDSPLHICRIRSIDKQNEFLKIEPSLFVDSCLCAFCWKYLEKTYKSNKSKNRKEELYSRKKSRLLECYVEKNLSRNQNQARRCSIYLCSRLYSHKLSVNEYEHLKKLFLTVESCNLVYVESRKQTGDFFKFPICLCKMHNAMILVMSTCQICGGKLNAPFNTDDWSMHKMWNFVLIENKLPLKLKPPMFICVTCKGHISRTNPGFPTIELPRLRKHIRINKKIRSKLYWESQYKLFYIYKGSTNVSSPIVVPKMRKEKECIRSAKAKFSDPLMTTNYNSETYSEETLPGCGKKETECITIVDSDDGMSLDSDCELKECKFELKPDHEIEMDKNDNSLQNLCQVDNVEIVENKLGIISSHQVVSEHNKIENNLSKLNSHAICSATQDRSSMDLKEAAESPNAKVNHVSMQRKQSNVICDTIYNKDAKNQILNEKYSSYDNNSTDDNTTKSYKNKNFAHPSINSPNLSIDVDENIQLNSNVPSIHIEKDYSLDLSCINNDAKMLLYLTENSQLLNNGELVVSETADEFSKDYLKEQKTTLYNCFGDIKDSINASKPFIHPSSHLYQYSNQLSSDNIEPLIIKDITTTTSSPAQSNSTASPKKNVAADEGVGSKFNNIRTKKLFPLCNSVSKSRNNRISTNSVSKVKNHLLTNTKSLLTNRIPYLPDKNQKCTHFMQQPLDIYDIQLPIGIKKKRAATNQTKPPVLL